MISKILDFAERRGGWWPCLSGGLIGAPVAWLAIYGYAWSWWFLALGLVMGAVRPAGTTVRWARRRRAALNDARDLMARVRRGEQP